MKHTTSFEAINNEITLQNKCHPGGIKLVDWLVFGHKSLTEDYAMQAFAHVNDETAKWENTKIGENIVHLYGLDVIRGEPDWDINEDTENYLPIGYEHESQTAIYNF